jgi:hypothetical protein
MVEGIQISRGEDEEVLWDLATSSVEEVKYELRRDFLHIHV